MFKRLIRHAATQGLLARVAAFYLRLALPTTRRRILPTWDQIRLPLPFGRGVLVCTPAISVPRDAWAAALPKIEAALTTAVIRADELCGA